MAATDGFRKLLPDIVNLELISKIMEMNLKLKS
jgi:hypothetical protein